MPDFDFPIELHFVQMLSFAYRHHRRLVLQEAVHRKRTCKAQPQKTPTERVTAGGTEPGNRGGKPSSGRTASLRSLNQSCPSSNHIVGAGRAELPIDRSFVMGRSVAKQGNEY